MKYGEKSFSVAVGSKEYRDNWERIFGKKEKEVQPAPPVSAFEAHQRTCIVCLNVAPCSIGEELWEKEYGP